MLPRYKHNLTNPTVNHFYKPTRTSHLTFALTLLLVLILPQVSSAQSEGSDTTHSSDEVNRLISKRLLNIADNLEETTRLLDELSKQLYDEMAVEENTLAPGDFDHDFAEKCVDSFRFCEDVIPSAPSNLKILELLNRGEYDKAIAQIQQRIDAYLETYTPWGTLKSNADPSQKKRSPIDLSLNHNLHLLARAFEMNGQYDEASETYKVIFPTNGSSWRWIEARLKYHQCNMPGALEKDKLSKDAWASICGVILSFYNLTPERVDLAVENAKEEALRRNINGERYFFSLRFLAIKPPLVWTRLHYIAYDYGALSLSIPTFCIKI